MKKQKQKFKKILTILIAMTLVFGVSIMLYATEPETTEFIFEDVNLYDALVKELDDYVYKTDRNTKTIKIITENISKIKQLKLANAQITSLNGIEGFSNLESLNLSGNNISKVEPISNLTTITTLNISGNKTSIVDLEKLSSLTNLVNVNFSASKLTNIDFMSTFSKLQILDVSGNTISSLTPIKDIVTLESLNIANNASFDRFETDICCHSNLNYLDISGTAIQSIEGIQTSLRQLETLKLRYLDVDLTPIVSTYKVDKITYVYLDKLQVLDISYTTKSISFSQLAVLNESLTDLYMIDVVGKRLNQNVSRFKLEIYI